MGDWHQGPDWVNGTIPVIATPGNHEYDRINQGPRHERYWRTKEGKTIEVNMTSFTPESTDKGIVYKASFVGPKEIVLLLRLMMVAILLLLMME